MAKKSRSAAMKAAWKIRKANAATRTTEIVKRGRKAGVKVGPYKSFSLKEMNADIKDLIARVAKLEKVLG